MANTKNASSDAIVLGLYAARAQVMQRDNTRITLKLQNQNAAAVIYRRFSGDGTPLSYLAMAPQTTEIMDFNCPPNDLWAYSDTAGAVLTVEVITDSALE
jgi:hypothetical protein